jgi:hypothetical protein
MKQLSLQRGKHKAESNKTRTSPRALTHSPRGFEEEEKEEEAQKSKKGPDASVAKGENSFARSTLCVFSFYFFTQNTKPSERP